MGSLVDATTREAPEEVYRLKAVSLSIPTDEQLAKAREKFPEAKAHVDLKVEWEPLSYVKKINNEVVPVETDYIRLTSGDGLSGIDGVTEAEMLNRVRSGGFPAIPATVRISLPRGIQKADPDKQTRPYQRFMVAAVKAGLTIDIDEDGSKTGTPGALVSPQVGQVFRARAGYEDFPKPETGPKGFFWNWDEPYSKFLRVPLEKLTNYVQPEDLPVRSYETAEHAEGSAATPVTTVSGGTGVPVEALREAVAVLDLNGKNVADVNVNAFGLALNSVGEAPILGAREVIEAAEQGRFVEYLVSKGVVNVVNGVVIG